MAGYEPEVKEDVVRRLRRIEGQVRGVQRMVEQDRDCHEIMQQMKAIDSAMRNARQRLVGAYARDCLLAAPAQDEKAIERVVDDLIGVLASSA